MCALKLLPYRAKNKCVGQNGGKKVTYMVAYVILDFKEMRQEMENIGNVFLIFLNASVKRIRAAS